MGVQGSFGQAQYYIDRHSIDTANSLAESRFRKTSMAAQHTRPDFSDVESRRSTASRRSMSLVRRLYYFFGMPLLRFVFFVLNSTYRVEKVIGAEVVEKILADKEQVVAPCYWHQHHVLCSGLMRQWIRRRGCRTAATDWQLR